MCCVGTAERKSTYGKVGVMPIRLIKSDVSGMLKRLNKRKSFVEPVGMNGSNSKLKVARVVQSFI